MNKTRFLCACVYCSRLVAVHSSSVHSDGTTAMSRLSLLHAVALLGWIASVSGALFNLTILHTNDIHCRFEQADKYGSSCTDTEAAKGKCFGGYPRLAHQISQMRRNNPNTIYLHGGDFFQGTIWYTIHKWKVVSHFANLLNLTAMVRIDSW